MVATTRFGFSSVGLPSRLSALALSGTQAAHRRTTLLPDAAADDGEILDDDDDDDDVRPTEAARTAARRSVLYDAATPTARVSPLYDDWREATLQAKARAAARAVVAADVEAVLAVAARSKGMPLSRGEAARATAAVYKAKRAELDAVYTDLLAASKKSRHLEDKALRDAVRAAAERVAQRPDPFAAIDARLVLWEGAALQVVVDAGAEAPKLLVVPKQAATFPVDVPAESARDARPVVAVTSTETGCRLVDDLAVVAAHAADALAAVLLAQHGDGHADDDADGAGEGARVAARTPVEAGASLWEPRIETWINPPQGAAFCRLHVHVAATGAPSWRDRGLDPRDLNDVRAAFAPARALLAKRLGGS